MLSDPVTGGSGSADVGIVLAREGAGGCASSDIGESPPFLQRVSGRSRVKSDVPNSSTPIPTVTAMAFILAQLGSRREV